ncbi:MAG: hypothetical protein NXH91_13875 [Phyllobacteriaceae bacterium]|jgi:hypothetical protein|nr:hypothetical protein [Phyllobacteriaceae bacterium]
MTSRLPLPTVKPVSGPTPRNDEARRADRLAEGGLFQCIAIAMVLIGALIAVP